VGDLAVAIDRTLAGVLWRSTVERRAALSPPPAVTAAVLTAAHAAGPAAPDDHATAIPDIST
jgi:hypothetical protein